MAIPRMRMATGVLAEIKEQDPDTQITLHYIRGIIKSEKVPVVKVGCKKLVDVDKVLEYLERGDNAEQVTDAGGIRPVQL